MQEGDVRHC